MIPTLLALALATAFPAHAKSGVQISAGGRYDNVRMCVGSPAGVPGGPAMDISFYTEQRLSDSSYIHLNLPFVRPLLFAGAFKMLQFEPDAALLFEKGKIMIGPMLGFSLHYGPDYKSGPDNPTDSFFAAGPRIGGHIGLNLGERYRLGITPYVTPLFSKEINGIVAGGSLDFQIGFGK